MEPFVRVSGVAAPLDRVNVDTDQIIPKQFLKRIERTGFGKFLFYDWRYLNDGSEPDPAFPLNAPAYQDARILLAGRNFGCGSSREHAPWALLDYGFQAIIAPSYADIFYNNCFKNGILPVTLPEEVVNGLMSRATSETGLRLIIDLAAQTIFDDLGPVATFEVEPFRKHCMLHGLDDIGLTLQYLEEITRYESARPAWKRGAVESTG